MTAITDWSGQTLTIPADADGATTATWRDDDGAVILTANAWWWRADGVLYLPADCQGREDETITETGEAVGRWINAADGSEAVVVDGAPRSAFEPTPAKRGPGQPQIGTPVKATIATDDLALIDAAIGRGEYRTRSEAVRALVAKALGK